MNPADRCFAQGEAYGFREGRYRALTPSADNGERLGHELCTRIIHGNDRTIWRLGFVQGFTEGQKP